MSAYVAVFRDKRQYALSASGSIFPVLARYTISQLGGMVCGAMFKDRELRHVLSNDWVDIERMQGSKYIESKFASVIPDIISTLEAGSWVLFVGTPCQVATIKLKVPQELLGNLLLVDLFCHGTPSQELFFTYIEKLGINIEDFVCASFRSKNPYDRSNYDLVVRSESRVISRNENKDVFVTAFKRSLSLQRKCYNCKFASLNRQGDLSLGDCAARRDYQKIAPGAVLSTVLVNSPCGERVWDSIKANLLWAPADEKKEATVNRALSGPAEVPKQREQFLMDMKEFTLEELEKQYVNYTLSMTVKYLVKRLVPAVLRDKLITIGSRLVG